MTDLVSIKDKGQIVIPAPLRKKFRLKKGSKLKIEEVEGGAMVLKPVPDDPVEKTRGILKGKKSLIESLLEDRREEAVRGHNHIHTII